MKRILMVAALSLAVVGMTTGSAGASGCCGPGQFSFGFGVDFNFRWSGGCCCPPPCDAGHGPYGYPAPAAYNAGPGPVGYPGPGGYPGDFGHGYAGGYGGPVDPGYGYANAGFSGGPAAMGYAGGYGAPMDQGSGYDAPVAQGQQMGYGGYSPTGYDQGYGSMPTSYGQGYGGGYGY